MSTPGPYFPATAARRSRRRRLVGVALLVVPLLELAVLIQVGTRIGVGRTLLLLLAAAVAGSLVLRSVGTAAIRRLSAATDPAAVPAAPTRPAAETALVVLAGVLLLVPGFLSDVAGLALLLPPVRRALARRAGDAVVRRFRVRSLRVVQGQVLDGTPGFGAPADVRITEVRVDDVPRPGLEPPRTDGRP
jgi:UPF0716 protein FxsA